jgi:short-subunit dehydrogenase
MQTAMNTKDRTAVVTGAAGGIGRGLALTLAGRGCNLALADINEEELTRTCELVAAQSNVRVSKHRLDVGDRAAIAAFPEQVKATHRAVDIVMNNAGVALGGTFEQTSDADFEWLFEINFWGVVRMTRAFLPLLKASDDACFVNVSSLYGLIAPTGQSAYSASKFAVRGFSQSLRHELEGTNVGVLVVHPGGVATSIAKSARIGSTVPKEDADRHQRAYKKMLRLPAERAAEIIVNAMEKRKARVIVGADAKAISLVERIAPASYWNLCKRIMPS